MNTPTGSTASSQPVPDTTAPDPASPTGAGPRDRTPRPDHDQPVWTATDPGRVIGRLTTAGGIALIFIATMHLVVMSLHGSWPGWLAGDLRTAMADDPAIGSFWAGIGGFAVPVAMLGGMIIRIGRRRERCSPVISYGLLVWAVTCCWLLGPSGFFTFLVPAALLIIADLATRLRRGR